MTQLGYQIVPYRHEFMYQVVILMHYLWGGNPDLNVTHFKWKYYDNPFSERPLGIVALHGEKVVGFRGFFVTKWHVPGKDLQFNVLNPGDTTVHPDHRRKGLSTEMANKAMEEYESQYGIFLNTSANRYSTPGYLKLGFVPLADKTQLMRYNLLALMAKKYLLTSKLRVKISEARIKTGNFANIEVSVSPKPAEMASIISRQNYESNRIRLVQDTEFFKWRFIDPKSRYIFYYHQIDNRITGYMVLLIRVRGNFRQGVLLDYAANDDEALSKIIRLMAKKRHADIFSIYSASLDSKYEQMLIRNGFKAKSLLEQREARNIGLMPYLVRPIKRDCVETDWFKDGYDIRKIANWELKGICMD